MKKLKDRLDAEIMERQKVQDELETYKKDFEELKHKSVIDVSDFPVVNINDVSEQEEKKKPKNRRSMACLPEELMKSRLVVQLGEAVDAELLLHSKDREERTNELGKLLTVAGIDIKDEGTMAKITDVLINFNPNQELSEKDQKLISQ